MRNTNIIISTAKTTCNNELILTTPYDLYSEALNLTVVMMISIKVN